MNFISLNRLSPYSTKVHFIISYIYGSIKSQLVQHVGANVSHSYRELYTCSYGVDKSSKCNFNLTFTDSQYSYLIAWSWVGSSNGLSNKTHMYGITLRRSLLLFKLHGGAASSYLAGAVPFRSVHEQERKPPENRFMVRLA